MPAVDLPDLPDSIDMWLKWVATEVPVDERYHYGHRLPVIRGSYWGDANGGWGYECDGCGERRGRDAGANVEQNALAHAQRCRYAWALAEASRPLLQPRLDAHLHWSDEMFEEIWEPVRFSHLVLMEEKEEKDKYEETYGMGSFGLSR